MKKAPCCLLLFFVMRRTFVVCVGSVGLCVAPTAHRGIYVSTSYRCVVACATILATPPSAAVAKCRSPKFSGVLRASAVRRPLTIDLNPSRPPSPPSACKTPRWCDERHKRAVGMAPLSCGEASARRSPDSRRPKPACCRPLPPILPTPPPHTPPYMPHQAFSSTPLSLSKRPGGPGR